MTVQAVVASNRALYRVRSVIHDERNDVSPDLASPARENWDIGAMPLLRLAPTVRVPAPSNERLPPGRYQGGGIDQVDPWVGYDNYYLGGDR